MTWHESEFCPCSCHTKHGTNILDAPTETRYAVPWQQAAHDEALCSLDDEEMISWPKREYSKSAIDRAGFHLLPWWTDPEAKVTEDVTDAFIVVQNWRTSHGLPLNVFQATLCQRAARVEENVLIAQRMKRFASILNKLTREPDMKLSQMHDLGGCRAILSSVSAVNRLRDMYREDEPLIDAQGSLKYYDYIKDPKDTGYRGIHIVGRYKARSEAREPWNGHRIEIQIRSRLQHAFATAVETVTSFTRQPLKFGSGPEEWRRFFSLASSAFAIKESTPLVPETPTDETELLKELKDITVKLRIRRRLHGWTEALRTLPKEHVKNSKWLLLVLNTESNTIKVTGYIKPKDAVGELKSIEQQRSKDIDAVMVAVGAIKSLREAYPNYYADTRDFISALDSVIGK